MPHPASTRLSRALRAYAPWEVVVGLAVLSTVVVTSASAASPGTVRSLLGATSEASRTPVASAAAVPPRAAAPPAPAAVAPVPVVRPVGRLVEPDLLITSTAPLGPWERRVVAGATGVRATLPLAFGQVKVVGATVHAIAVDPSRFRAWTPQVTATSDPLWRTVAQGTVAASFDAGRNLRLPLGGQLLLGAARSGATVPATLGALASTGLPGVDLTVGQALGGQLGLVPGAAMVVSAPHADLTALRDGLRKRLGPRYQVVLLRQMVVLRDAGSYLTRVQIQRLLQVALAQVGKPYVWGATGPSSYDCSGLVGYAYAAAGVAMPRTSEQLWFAGPHVPPQDARPGDLLFWANDPSAPNDIDHVAIYLGRGLMVSAPHTGDYVHVSPVYPNNFRGVVRVDPAMAARVGGPMWFLGQR